MLDAVKGERQLQNMLEIAGEHRLPAAVGKTIGIERNERAAQHGEDSKPRPGDQQQRQDRPIGRRVAGLCAGERIDNPTEQHRLGELRRSERRVTGRQQPTEPALGSQKPEHASIEAKEIQQAHDALSGVIPDAIFAHLIDDWRRKFLGDLAQFAVDPHPGRHRQTRLGGCMDPGVGSLSLPGHRQAVSDHPEGATMRVVTLEEHFSFAAITNRIDKATIAARGFVPHGRRPGMEDLQVRLEDVGENRLKSMDDNGITAQVLSVSGPGADLLEGEAGIALARDYNDAIFEKVKPHPTRFAAFAHLPMTAPQAAADELERCVVELGFCGALINGVTNDRFLDDPQFAPILARVEKLDVAALSASRHSSQGGARRLLRRNVSRGRLAARNGGLRLALRDRDPHACG